MFFKLFKELITFNFGQLVIYMKTRGSITKNMRMLNEILCFR